MSTVLTVQQLDQKIYLILSQLNWTLSHPKIVRWMGRCGFTAFQAMTFKAKHSLMRYLECARDVRLQLKQMGLDEKYIETWAAARNYRDDCMVMKDWNQLRAELMKNWNDDILF